jgi:hypothetical protein
MTPWFRLTLYVTAISNFFGFLIFIPPSFLFRRLLGLPISHSFYLSVLAFYILLFALVYGYFAQKNKADRSLIFVGLLGKAFFSLALLYFSVFGDISLLTASVGFPDLVFALLFAIWLGQTREQR